MMIFSQSHSKFIITNQTATAFIGLYCMAVVMGFGRFLFTATLPDIMSQLSLSTPIAGWLASINYIGYFFGALIAIFVPHRLTWQMLMLWVSVSIVTTLLLSMSQLSLNIWYGIRFLAGVASGVAMILSSSLVIQRFTDERRYMLSSIHYAGIGAGISASAILSWVLLAWGFHFDLIWRSAAIISLPVVILLFAIRPSKPTIVDNSNLADNNKNSHKVKKNSIYQIYIEFKRAIYDAVIGHTTAIALLSASYLLAGFGYITSATFLPVMAVQRLTEQSTTGQNNSGLLIWLIVGIFAMLSNPIWGALAKRIGEIKTLMGLTLLQSLGMLLPLWLDGASGLYGNAVILGLTFAGIVSMTLVIIKNINPIYSNLLMGLATLAYSIGQFIGPLVTVALAGQSNNFNAGLQVAGVGLFFSLILLIWFYRQTSITN
ncbi:YbfB/YjiJ family MFS transporter [Psychrobacter sp. GP33]|uniref:YbfB/YjiJ family MFS transporter n=1 Tax=Psychrobacter sp. GP33 TaxID=2758709 RepID=UPI002174E7B4|nr:YbfB/YjiJ family MFS transporter [Psychrobacter sp. GP33]